MRVTPMDSHYRVSADHTVPKYACTDAPCRVSSFTYPGAATVYSASMAGYGCGKDYATPEAAIRGMLASHDCTNVRIKPVETTKG